MKNIHIILIGTVLLAGAFLLGGSPANNFSGAINQPIYTSATNSSTTITTAATLILSADSGRQNAQVCNKESNGGHMLYLTELAATDTVTTTEGQVGYFTAGTGREVQPGTCYEYNDDNLITGNIYGIATTTITVTNISH